jgi:rod shape-determining protein MreC
VISQPPSQFDRTLVISAGANDGIRWGNAVIDPDGYFVGTITLVNSDTARVTLLVDETSAVAVKDPQTGARGVVKESGDSGNSLMVDRVTKDERVREGDQIITSGFRYGDLSSLYPKGIPIGWVSSFSQLDTDEFKRVEVHPYADFSNIDSVTVVVTPESARGLP